MSEYRRHYRSEGITLAIRADFRQAASQLEYKLESGKRSPLWHEDSDWHGTPYQVADARHRPSQAFPLVKRWVDSNG